METRRRSGRRSGSGGKRAPEVLLFLSFAFAFFNSFDSIFSCFTAVEAEVVAPTWAAIKANNPRSQQWQGITVHKDGDVQVGVVLNGHIWISKNSGSKWREVEITPGSTQQYEIAAIADDDANLMIVAATNSDLYKTTDGGTTWTTITNTALMTQTDTSALPSWKGLSMSADGQYITVNSYNGKMFVSSDFGATWTEAKLSDGTNMGAKSFTSCAMSANGKFQTAVVESGYLYRSDDYGATFSVPTGMTSTESWKWVRMSRDGKYQLATVMVQYVGGYMVLSNDEGVTWTKITGQALVPNIDTYEYTSVSVSGDGRVMMATAFFSEVVRSEDYGQTWTGSANGHPSASRWDEIALSYDGKVVLAYLRSSYLYMGRYECIPGTYGTFPNCNACPENTCSFGGDVTIASSCSAELCFNIDFSSAESGNDMLVKNPTEFVMKLPTAVPAGNTLRFEFHSSNDPVVTNYILNSADPSSSLLSDAEASSYLEFREGEREKTFKLQHASTNPSKMYVVMENVAPGGTYALPNRYPLYSPRTIVARKKKIYASNINDGAAISQMHTYDFIVTIEALPSAEALASGLPFSVGYASTYLVFSMSDGNSEISFSTTSLTNNLRMYAVEIGTQDYRVNVPPESIFYEEYEFELPAPKTVDISVRCGSNMVPERENVYTGEQTKKCVACPTGTTAKTSADSLLDCICPAGTVDVRVQGILPDTYTVALDAYPCASASLYCENREIDETLGTYKQCVEFLEGKPVGVIQDYYRYKYEGWDLVIPGSETATIELTDAELLQLTPLVPVLSCTGATCEYNATGVASSGCKSGSEGPLCSVCQKDYYWHQDDEQCEKCSLNPDGYFSSEFIAVIIIAISIFIGVAMLIVPIRDKLDEIEIFRAAVRAEFRTRFGIFRNDVSSGKKQVQFITDGQTLKERLASGPTMPSSFRYRLGRKIYDFLEDLAPKMKMLIGFMQVIMLWPETLYFVSWPNGFNKFVQALKVFALDFELLPIDCVVQRDYYAKFLAATISPFVGCAFIMSCFGFASFVFSRVGKVDSSRRYIGYGVKTCVMLLFIIYPSVSGTILQYFPCRDIGGGVRYLRFSIETSCDTEKYDNFAPLVYIMLVVYVISIPVLFLAFMSSDSKSQYFRILLKDYKAQHWYFEIIDMLRKLFLGAVIIFVGDNESDLQLYVIVFVTMAFLVLLGMLKPYRVEDDNVIAQIVNMELGFIALIAIAIKAGADSLGSEKVVNGLVLFAVISVVLTCVASGVLLAFVSDRDRHDFTKYDSDMSGDMDRDELKMLLRDLKKNDSDDICDLIFSKFDKEKQDTLDFDEFIEAGTFIHSLPEREKKSFKISSLSFREKDAGK